MGQTPCMAQGGHCWPRGGPCSWGGQWLSWHVQALWANARRCLGSQMALLAQTPFTYLHFPKLPLWD